MICSDGRAAIRAIGAHRITFGLVLECHDDLERLCKLHPVRTRLTCKDTLCLCYIRILCLFCAKVSFHFACAIVEQFALHVKGENSLGSYHVRSLRFVRAKASTQST